MMNITEITSLNQSGIEVFSTLTEAQLRMNLEPEKGLFIAESPKVIRVALDAGWQPTALLCERKNKPIHFTDFDASVRDIVNITAVAVIDAYVEKLKKK